MDIGLSRIACSVRTKRLFRRRFLARQELMVALRRRAARTVPPLHLYACNRHLRRRPAVRRRAIQMRSRRRRKAKDRSGLSAESRADFCSHLSFGPERPLMGILTGVRHWMI